MLEMKQIKKSYKTGDFVQDALKGIDVTFRKNEFVAILGPSGSGKTTLLNIIGGLDRYDSGDLIINDKSTKAFKATEWDAYRNNCIGFVFQSYNLITHISVQANVEMSMTLSGYSRKERREKALDALDKVGLKEHAHKKPNQLSGGQMQRVAIARALVNNPDVVLADEPTGALDSETSVQIMNLIQEIAKDKLVIMVTHNPELAKQYANRVVELKDGEIIKDTNPVEVSKEEKNTVTIKKTAMNYASALRLSFNNIKTKKGRTLLTSFASSIGIIGIALILALSNGFQMEINTFEKDSLSQMPIIISEQSMEMSPEAMQQLQEEANEKGFEKYSSKKEIVPMEDAHETMMHTNNLTPEYFAYLDGLEAKDVGGISYMRATGMNIMTKASDGTYKMVNTQGSMMNSWQLFPSGKEDGSLSVIEDNYDVIAGSVKSDEPGLILMVDAQNRLGAKQLESLGFGIDENIGFEELLAKEIKVIPNDVYYEDKGFAFLPTQNNEAAFQNESSVTLKIQAVLRGKPDKELITSGTGIGYTESLVTMIIEQNKDSNIVRKQEVTEYNVLSGQPFETGENATNTKDMMISYLGADTTPIGVYIYPKNFEAKDHIIAYLDAYNKGKEKVDTVQYTDMASMISALSGDIMGAITIVLIAFSAISLIVSSIMIGIITYISVLERTKEIGILRALGARKRDITRVFNAETLIIGLCSGLIGIGIAQLLTIPANIIIEDLSGLANVAKLDPIHAILLITISVALTIIGGFIPAKLASKKDPVIALRSE